MGNPDVPKPPPWPAYEVESVPIGALDPYGANSRTHSERQVAEIAASMREFGWTTAVLRDEEGTILAGHGRILAAQLLVQQGHARFAEAPVVTARGWTANQKRAYVIADNKIAANAGWDPSILAAELQALSVGGFDMSLLGFTTGELRGAMGGGGLTDPDDTPAVQSVLITRPGDCWLLGGHRIICGSSTDAATVASVLAGEVPKLMVTDPPYGVSYDPTWREKITGQKVRARGKVLNDDRADWREAWALFPGDVAYVWHGGLHSGPVQASLEAVGFQMRAQIIWAKDRLVLSRGHFHWRHEPCWYAVRKGRTGGWRGGRKRDTVWRVDGLPADQALVAQTILEDQGAEDTVWEIPLTVDDGSTGHGTQKPVECMRRPLELNSAEGDFVYEPFSGSGSTIIAGQMTGRRVLAVELSPAYVDVAVRRWQSFTGKTATLRGTGETFASREPQEFTDATWA